MLIDMLRPAYQNSPEVSDLQNAIGGEAQKARDACNDLLLQLNVDTATWGLGLWEDAYGIPHDVTKSYDFRRSQVKAKRRSQGTTTIDMIKNLAESYSNGDVDVIEHPEQYSFDVKFIGTIGIPPNMDDLTKAIEEIKPAHLTYIYIYVWITWDMVEAYNYTWDGWDAKGLTWDAFESYKE